MMAEHFRAAPCGFPMRFKAADHRADEHLHDPGSSRIIGLDLAPRLSSTTRTNPVSASPATGSALLPDQYGN
jgi:hypothetical protein